MELRRRCPIRASDSSGDWIGNLFAAEPQWGKKYDHTFSGKRPNPPGPGGLSVREYFRGSITRLLQRWHDR